MPCSWLKRGSDAMLSNTKQMDVKTRHSKVQLRAILKGSFECLGTGNLTVTRQAAQHRPSHPQCLQHQEQTPQ